MENFPLDQWEHLELTKAGEWSPYNTVMIDDTSSKLRGQPDSKEVDFCTRLELVSNSSIAQI